MLGLSAMTYRRVIGAVVLLALWSCAAAAMDGSSRVVELKLKIVPFPADRGYKAWEVEAIDSRGNVVSRKSAAGGDTVRFKGLAPDIYMVCLTSAQRSHRCRSYDLVPPSGAGPYVFDRTIRAPKFSSATADAMTVSVATLAIPADARREFRRSIEAKEKGEEEKSLRHLHQALEIHPDFAHALNDLGAYHYAQGDYRQSMRSLTRAVELEPGHYAAWINLGKSHLAMGSHQEAISATGQALELRPNDPLANSQMAFSHYFRGDLDGARKYFLRVAELDPASASHPQLYLARIAFTKKHQAEGAEYLRRFISLHPNLPQSAKFQVVLQNIRARIADGAASGNAPSPE
ncbi:MAG: tetratricopeptide repeat protein [Acidobacteria bacterium]|nr:tetratricopeptide repeat protein [Acidobacteriota bacterium]